MASSREELLTRYLSAATTLSEFTTTRQDTIKVSEPLASGSSSRCDREEPIDPAMTAMADLLARQARILVKLHTAFEADPDESQDYSHKEDAKLLLKRIDDMVSISTTRFYSYKYDVVPRFWREVYTNALILETHYHVLKQLVSNTEKSMDKTLDLVVERLDKALITAGAAAASWWLGPSWIEGTLQKLEAFSCSPVQTEAEENLDSHHHRPAKRIKAAADQQDEFSDTEPFGRPSLSEGHQCPRYSEWTMDRFETYMNPADGRPRPIVFTDLISDWPALTDRPWKSLSHLLSKTFGGRRLIPVEIGRSYVDEGWGQELIPFATFIQRYIIATTTRSASSNKTGYLAQHNLFQQIPSLRNDIQVPNFCWVDVPRHPTNPSQDQAPLDLPSLNAWFGPAKTITPLHTDGYHNILAQVVGTKYVRLYPPWATDRMRPRGNEYGVDMSNTSELDVGVLEGWDEVPEAVTLEELEDMRKGLKDVEYWECVLRPGDTLVIPIGWWHYVRSLSVSFSVSFWWN